GTYSHVDVSKPVNLRSINGPQSTWIDGGGTISCVYLRAKASLSGFTLTNGFSSFGGGVLCESSTAVVSNCRLAGNRASYGGGAYRGTLNNCTLTGNSAGDGGAAQLCTLNN